MAAYADYTFYTSEYLGSAIAEADFDRLALRASEEIDHITFERAAAVTDTDTIILIKKATCAVAETLQTIEKAGGAVGVQSERVGNYSVTYAEGSPMQQTKDDQVRMAAVIYLGVTGLMFQGFYAGEGGQ